MSASVYPVRPELDVNRPSAIEALNGLSANPPMVPANVTVIPAPPNVGIEKPRLLSYPTGIKQVPVGANRFW